MVVPFIALIAVIALIIFFLAKTGKRKSEGKEPVKSERGTV